MKAKINKNHLTITFTGIANESQLEDVTFLAEKAECQYIIEDYSTKVIVRAKTQVEFNKFIILYNK